MIKGAAIIGWLGLAVVGGLYLNLRDDFAAAQGEWKAQLATSNARIKNQTIATLSAAHTRDLLARDQIIQSKDNAMTAARESARNAQAGVTAREKVITQLQLEADIDEIPDSNACLIVYPRRSAIDGLLYTGTCASGIAANRDTGAGSVCRSAAGINPTDSAFSNITYGDALILWGRDRAIIKTLNGQLASIYSLMQ